MLRPKILNSEHLANKTFEQLFLNTLCNLQNSLILCEIGEKPFQHVNNWTFTDLKHYVFSCLNYSSTNGITKFNIEIIIEVIERNNILIP